LKRIARSSAWALCALAATASAATAQQAPERARFEFVSGVLLSGAIANADFAADFSSFGGALIRRSGGTLDVDPSVWYGVRGSYRINERLSLSGTWMHSRGRFRVQFPALASVSGNFDLEGLLLAGDDFGIGGAEQAMSDAITDVYLASASWEFPVLERWALPYLTLGGGIYTQRSDGNVIAFEYEGDLPPFVEALDNVGMTQAEVLGLSVFGVRETNPVLAFGAGVRVSLAERWGINVRFEDLMRLGVDLTEIDASSTPPPDPDAFILYSTTFRGKKGSVHNYGIQFSLNYSLWPWGAPR
jgi:hypothetical protein